MQTFYLFLLIYLGINHILTGKKKAILYSGSLIQLLSQKTDLSTNQGEKAKGWGGKRERLTTHIQTIHTLYKPKLTEEQHLLQFNVITHFMHASLIFDELTLDRKRNLTGKTCEH